jgi:hypothetical protein
MGWTKIRMTLLNLDSQPKSRGEKNAHYVHMLTGKFRRRQRSLVLAAGVFTGVISPRTTENYLQKCCSFNKLNVSMCVQFNLNFFSKPRRSNLHRERKIIRTQTVRATARCQEIRFKCYVTYLCPEIIAYRGTRHSQVAQGIKLSNN